MKISNYIKKVLLLSIVFAYNPITAKAEQRSKQQAKAIAERQAEKLGIAIDKKTARIKATGWTAKDGEAPAFYIFSNGKDKGFTIVSGDDRMPEIVGYSDKGNYDETELPENYLSFMKAYSNLEEWLTEGKATAMLNIEEVRQHREANKSAVVVAPLLGDIEWSQYAPFNNMCPQYDGVNNAASGCVATAMAQIMAYHKYPTQLSEDIPGYEKAWDTYTTKVQTISKTDGVYDWNNILPKYSTGGYTQEQADAVAKLVSHCGAAVQMGYGKVSGAYASPVPLAKYFGYDADLMQKVFRSSFTLSEWTNLLDNELAAKRPVLYSGTSSAEGGHEFVCDGADGNGLYHINWGWDGRMNGYFDLTILNSDYEGKESKNSPDGYNIGCAMIIGISPDNGVKDNPLVEVPSIVVDYNKNRSKVELTNATRNNVSENFSLRITNDFTNQTMTDLYSVRQKYGIMDESGEISPLGKNSNRLNISGIGTDGSYGLQSGVEMSIDYAFPVGRTTIYAIYSTNGYEWHKCAYRNMQPLVVEATETTIKVVETELEANLTAESELTSGKKASFNISVKNNGDSEYLGYLNIFSSVNATMPDEISSYMYVSIPAHSAISKTITLTPSGKKLYLWATDYKGVTLAEGKEFSLNTSAEPVLSLVKVWNNATPGAYETENAYYINDKVKAPRVDDDNAIFRYDIQNDGATTVLKCGIGVNNNFPSDITTVNIPGNGKITTISKSFSTEDAGSRNILAELRTFDETGMNEITIPTELPKNKLECTDGSSYSLPQQKMFVYLAGLPEGSSISLPATKDGLYYATYSNLENAVKFSVNNGERINAYTIGIENGNTMKRTERTGTTVAKGEAVLVESTVPNATVTPIGYDVDKASDNCLVPSGNINWETGYLYYRMTYADAKNKTGLGFYWGADDGGKFGFDVKAGVAILKVPVGLSDAKGFSFDFSGTTSLKCIQQNDNNPEQIFNLNGQRVNNDFKGIYIRNGKKYFRK